MIAIIANLGPELRCLVPRIVAETDLTIEFRFAFDDQYDDDEHADDGVYEEGVDDLNVDDADVHGDGDDLPVFLLSPHLLPIPHLLRLLWRCLLFNHF